MMFPLHDAFTGRIEFFAEGCGSKQLDEQRFCR